MCTLAFQGYGYSQSFVENYKKIASKVISDPNTKIEVVDNLDTICSVCPNQTKQGKCTTQAKVLELDRSLLLPTNIKFVSKSPSFC